MWPVVCCVSCLPVGMLILFLDAQLVMLCFLPFGVELTCPNVVHCVQACLKSVHQLTGRHPVIVVCWFSCI